MAYSSGTIGANANPAAALYTELVAAFDAHSNWDIVENVVISSVNHQVWRNNGSGNAFGSNFYVAVIYTPTAGTTLDIKCFESYDSTNDKAIRPCVGAFVSRTPNANSSFGNETTGFLLNDVTDMVYGRVSTPTTGFDWFIQVSANAVKVGTKFSTTDHAIYAGLFESLLAADPFPICVGGTSGQENVSTGDFGCSRQPNKTTAGTQNFMFQLENWSVVSGSAEVADVMHGTSVGSRALLKHVNSSPTTFGYIRGLLYDCFYLPDGTTTTRNGDSITVGANTYRKFKFGTVGLTPGVWVQETAA